HRSRQRAPGRGRGPRSPARGRAADRARLRRPVGAVTCAAGAAAGAGEKAAAAASLRVEPRDYFGCPITRRYGLIVFQPWGYFFFASSSETEPAMITSSPCFQLTGVATWCLAVSWIESRTRRISSKLRPVVIGYVSVSLIF